MNQNVKVFIFLFSTFVFGSNPTKEELDSISIFEFIKDEDLPKPTKKIDWLEAYDGYKVEISTAEMALKTLSQRQESIEKEIDTELRIARTTFDAISKCLANNEPLSPGQYRIVELVNKRKVILEEIKTQKWRARNAQLSIEWNKPLMESGCRQRIAAAEIRANEIIGQRNKAVAPLERLKFLRVIISDAITRYSVESPKVCISAMSPEQRSALHSTVTWALDNQSEDEPIELPRILRRKLGEKGWSFLHNWIEILDVILTDYRAKLVHFADKLKQDYANVKKSIEKVRTVLTELEQVAHPPSSSATAGK